MQHELAAEIVHAHGDASASGHAGCTAASAAACKGSFGSDGEAAGLADAVKEMESLYRSQDLSLKEGETIK